MIEDVALSRTFGEQAGRWFQELLEEHGVEVHGGEELEAFEGDGRVKAVVTKSGLALECDTVVVGAGVRPDTMLAERAGLEVDDGIVCDSKLQTSAPGIYAAGDCCSYDSVVHGRRMRVEHWDVAMQQGMHAARNMLGDDADYDVVPYFFSDLADWAGLEYVGPAFEWDDEIWRGDRDARRVLGLVPEGRAGSRARSASAAPKTSPRPGACSPTASTSPAPRSRSPTPTAISPRSAPELRRGARGILRAHDAPWCNGSTPRSGRGSRGSSPWGAAKSLHRADLSLCYRRPLDVPPTEKHLDRGLCPRGAGARRLRWRRRRHDRGGAG